MLAVETTKPRAANASSESTYVAIEIHGELTLLRRVVRSANLNESEHVEYLLQPCDVVPSHSPATSLGAYLAFGAMGGAVLLAFGRAG